MIQSAAQTISSLWPMMGTLGALRTPSRRSTFDIDSVTPERVKVLAGQSGIVIPKAAFEAVVEYLHDNGHHAGNPCTIESDNDHDKAGPLCKIARRLPAGGYGPRTITYLLPILEQLGVVGIRPSRPTAVWLTTVAGTASVDPLPILAAADVTPAGSLSAVQQAFARHLATLWSGAPGSFKHRYLTTTHHSWKPWKARSQGDDWWCLTLAQAQAHYSWPESAAPHDFASIAARLRSALAENDHAAALQACLDIFDWGGVARKEDDASLVWVKAQAVAKTLCGSILAAVELLRPGCTQSLKAFDGKDLLMNSAMTKIYAAADPKNIIIYDGRVGAALGLLARQWLEAAGESVVPADLAFRWGPNTKTPSNKVETRDPSRGGFQFIQLYRSTAREPNPTQTWAELVRMTNRLLREVIRLRAQAQQSVTLLALERALFMVGYDVRCLPAAVKHPPEEAGSWPSA
ncbi:hypothetical protein I4N56_024995 [Pseudomonas mohnii]|uniref:hypothetical protein n=1 Tax=Pseudomonas mohnii TaxID=395600 RepID=UPI0018C6DDBE|nr:hypothetical protein [Pseudomonas mohnii]MBH8613793.1 hypothetical protein [Pseudomonas mohnii]